MRALIRMYMLLLACARACVRAHALVAEANAFMCALSPLETQAQVHLRHTSPCMHTQEEIAKKRALLFKDLDPKVRGQEGSDIPRGGANLTVCPNGL